jgi:hypothetical protein
LLDVDAMAAVKLVIAVATHGLTPSPGSIRGCDARSRPARLDAERGQELCYRRPELTGHTDGDLELEPAAREKS